MQKQFRIERINTQSQVIANDSWDAYEDLALGSETGSSRMILSELKKIKELIQPAGKITENVLKDYQSGIEEASKLKTEMQQMLYAIEKTKVEIASLHITSLDNGSMHKVTDELDAVIGGTEQATNTILSAAEKIDSAAGDLAARLKGTENELATEIQEQVIQIFESCNFQDLTGQRITKVVRLVKFMEERVHNMMDIWGGIETFAHVDATEMPKPEGDKALLNGPSLESDLDVATQDDIDALFD